MDRQKLVKIRLSFDGWHCLSRKQTKEILREARKYFVNANFASGVGILIEDYHELKVHDFCLKILSKFKGSFQSWDGYELKRLSNRLLFNFADRKRKLNFKYFKKLFNENELKDVKIVLAGILYLEPDEVKDLIISIEKDNCAFNEMNEDDLRDAYRILLMYASSKDRSFSLNK